jgi:hypothetical protein
LNDACCDHWIDWESSLRLLLLYSKKKTRSKKDPSVVVVVVDVVVDHYYYDDDDDDDDELLQSYRLQWCVPLRVSSRPPAPPNQLGRGWLQFPPKEVVRWSTLEPEHRQKQRMVMMGTTNQDDESSTPWCLLARVIVWVGRKSYSNELNGVGMEWCWNGMGLL